MSKKRDKCFQGFHLWQGGERQPSVLFVYIRNINRTDRDGNLVSCRYSYFLLIQSSLSLWFSALF